MWLDQPHRDSVLPFACLRGTVAALDRVETPTTLSLGTKTLS